MGHLRRIDVCLQPLLQHENSYRNKSEDQLASVSRSRCATCRLLRFA